MKYMVLSNWNKCCEEKLFSEYAMLSHEGYDLK